MATPYVMPKLAMAMNEGTVNEWLVNHGDKVEKGQPLASVETEKVAYDVESPEEGFFCIIVQPGETVPCEELIAYFCDSADEVETMLASAGSSGDSAAAEEVAPAASDSAPAPSAAAPAAAVAAPVLEEGARIIASPLAKKLAKDGGLNLRLVGGTGPGGREGGSRGCRSRSARSS